MKGKPLSELLGDKPTAAGRQPLTRGASSKQGRGVPVGALPSRLYMDFMPCGRDFVVSADKCKLLASLWEQMSYPISPDPSGGNKKLILNKNCQGELHLFFVSHYSLTLQYRCVTDRHVIKVHDEVPA